MQYRHFIVPLGIINANNTSIMNPDRVLILQYYTPDISDYAHLTAIINSKYAKRWGYKYECVKLDTTFGAYPTWWKFFLIKDRLEREDVDYVFFLDADAFVNNDKVLEYYFKDQNTEFGICKNGPNGGDLLNTGSMFLKKGFYSISICSMILESFANSNYKLNHYHEQTELDRLIVENPNIKDWMTIYEYNVFNSWWRDCEKEYYNPNQFILHVMARPLDEKVRIIKEFFNKQTTQVL